MLLIRQFKFSLCYARYHFKYFESPCACFILFRIQTYRYYIQCIASLTYLFTISSPVLQHYTNNLSIMLMFQLYHYYIHMCHRVRITYRKYNNISLVYILRGFRGLGAVFALTFYYIMAYTSIVNCIHLLIYIRITIQYYTIISSNSDDENNKLYLSLIQFSLIFLDSCNLYLYFVCIHRYILCLYSATLQEKKKIATAIVSHQKKNINK